MTQTQQQGSGPLDSLPLGNVGQTAGGLVNGVTGALGGVAGNAVDGKGKSDTLRLRLDLNLDIEITLKAKIHGDLELALLLVFALFSFPFPLLHLPSPASHFVLPLPLTSPSFSPGLKDFVEKLELEPETPRVGGAGGVASLRIKSSA